VCGHGGVDDLVDVVEVVVDRALGQRAGVGDCSRCAAGQAISCEHHLSGVDDLLALVDLVG